MTSMVTPLLLSYFRRDQYTAAAFAAAGLYDHVLTFVQEIDLVWTRYLGDSLLVYKKSETVPDSLSLQSQILINLWLLTTSGRHNLHDQVWPNYVVRCLRNIVIMQMRVYAMYMRSKKVLVILLLCFLAEFTAALVILSMNFGIGSLSDAQQFMFLNFHVCYDNGTNDFSAAAFIPFLCFETLLFCLAAQVAFKHLREMKTILGEWRVHSMLSILARDSLWTNLFGSYMELVSVPFIDLVTVTTSSRLILSIRQRRYLDSGWQVDNDRIGGGAEARHQWTKVVVLRGSTGDGFDGARAINESPCGIQRATYLDIRRLSRGSCGVATGERETTKSSSRRYDVGCSKGMGKFRLGPSSPLVTLVVLARPTRLSHGLALLSINSQCDIVEHPYHLDITTKRQDNSERTSPRWRQPKPLVTFALTFWIGVWMKAYHGASLPAL
ncbi:hypothetical protein BV22DRAFT_1048897 [Leucogyrophana mollusca]|uniref:Uncharacterized protein n=1 Tax=Leucogyrophana mollusca TaxID=85980 RepID=A0ACB8BBT1_9AGAM|nr:hypothetical protein BV22DRAFT_1048897 [Leucogyrophana mollusca]